MKEFTVIADDLTENAKITCTLTGTSPDYGGVYVDENMNLIHVPAEADANDTLHLENCILSVETPGNEYKLDGNVLSVVRHRLNGSVTAEAWVYTAAPEKLVEFAYDSNGMRTQKKVTDHGQTVTTNYIYNGKKLVELTCGEDTLHFFYDLQGMPAQVECNGNVYIYIQNLQGDVLGILNEKGDAVVEYDYAPYGEPQELYASNDRIANLNIFSYRAYVWDKDCQLYNLRNRYYSPQSMRFLNGDLQIGKIGDLLSHNISIYCENNPVNRCDYSGYSSVSVLAKFEEFIKGSLQFLPPTPYMRVIIGGAMVLGAMVEAAKGIGSFIQSRKAYVARKQAAIKEAIISDASQLIEEQGDIYIYRWHAVENGIYGFVPRDIDDDGLSFSSVYRQGSRGAKLRDIVMAGFTVVPSGTHYSVYPTEFGVPLSETMNNWRAQG